MALTKGCSTFLFYSKKLGASFDKSLMLGRLNLYATKEDMAFDIARFGVNAKNPNDVVFKDGYSEPLFEVLGASVIDSMDFSSYEKATIVHDLNQPIPAEYKKKYTAIVDGGTIEHVFNFPVAIRNCMEMLQVGGHYIGITAANNLMGHGLYQFSPELLYNIFREENGFEIKKMVIVAQTSSGEFSKKWYEVMDPRKVRTRVSLINSKPTYLMVLAEKKVEKPIFQTPPLQSDYEVTWEDGEPFQQNKAQKNESKLRHLYNKFTPRRLKILVHTIYNLFTKRERITGDLGKIRTEHFKKMDI